MISLMGFSLMGIILLYETGFIIMLHFKVYLVVSFMFFFLFLVDMTVCDYTSYIRFVLQSIHG